MILKLPNKRNRNCKSRTASHTPDLDLQELYRLQWGERTSTRELWGEDVQPSLLRVPLRLQRSRLPHTTPRLLELEGYENFTFQLKQLASNSITLLFTYFLFNSIPTYTSQEGFDFVCIFLDYFKISVYVPSPSLPATRYSFLYHSPMWGLIFHLAGPLRELAFGRITCKGLGFKPCSPALRIQTQSVTFLQYLKNSSWFQEPTGASDQLT